MTKTQQLRAALEKLGFTKVETKSQRDCLRGFSIDGRFVYVFLNEVGGGRWNREAKVGGAAALSDKTIALVLSGAPSNLLHHG